MQNIEELKKCREKYEQEVQSIQKQITAQASKKFDVNALYERINRLEDKIAELDALMPQTTYSSTGSKDNQLEKGIAISSGGGGTSIRPSSELMEETEPGKFGAAGTSGHGPVIQVPAQANPSIPVQKK